MRRRLLPSVLLVTLVAAAACTGDGGEHGTGSTAAGTTQANASTSVPSADLPPALTELLATAESWRWFTKGDDVLEVWVCHVPDDTQAGIYGGLPLRLPLTAKDVTDVLRSSVPNYFETISHHQYRPVFEVGGEIDMAATDEPGDCIAAAQARARTDAKGLFVVADAEHGGTEPGGFGDIGAACAQTSCPVADTGRAAYIGASDFHPDWGDRKPMDLAEHEIGHLLGWGHSGVVGRDYLSALDVMSNSAAPRDTDPDRRDAPDTIALNRLLAGWLPTSDVWVAPADGGSVTLAPSTGEGGTRVAVLPVSESAFLTVELLTATGFDAHLPTDGIAVHMVEVGSGRAQTVSPLTGEAPFTDLLQVGQSLDAEGWRIEVVGDGAAWTVRVVSSS